MLGVTTKLLNDQISYTGSYNTSVNTLKLLYK